MVIADNAATFANEIFNNSSQYSGSTLVLGAIFFTFQIYGDFSGYSDIAIGTARLFGFKLKRNFHFPYFSRDIAEFWRKWHISLSTWFRDYLYIPLGGSRGSTYKRVRNTFIIFVVSGFWHGANWTFIVWGALNAIYFLPLLLSNKNRKNLGIVAQDRLFPTVKEVLQMGITFSLTVFAWIFFRADSISHAWQYIQNIFSSSLFSYPVFKGMHNAPTLMLLILVFMFIEWLSKKDEYALEKLPLQLNKYVRYILYYAIVLAILWYGGEEQTFIYFQF